MKTIILLFCLFAGNSAYAKADIDWKVCAEDLSKNCALVKGDHEKHECLEKAGDKVAKECRSFNEKLEGKFKEHHKNDHAH